MKGIISRLDSREEIDFGFDVAYPVREIGSGASATVFMTADKKILRVSKGKDYLLHHLDADWMSKSLNSIFFDGYSVILRDDIPDVISELPIFNKQTKMDSFDKLAENYPDMPGIGDGSARFINLPNNLFLYDVANLLCDTLEPEITVSFLKQLIELSERFPEKLSHKAKNDFRKAATDIYNNTFHTMKLVDGSYRLKDRMCLFVSEDGKVRKGKSQIYKSHFMSKAVIVFEFILKNNLPTVRDGLHFLTKIIEDTGLMPADSHEDNIGFKDGLIFRDPYYLKIQHADYQIRINQHRLSKGLPAVPEWPVLPSKIDLMTALMLTGDRVICDRFGMSEQANYTAWRQPHGCEIEEDSKMNDSYTYMVSDARIGHIIEKLSEFVPVANNGQFSELDESDLRRFLNVMGWHNGDISQVEIIPTYVQKIPRPSRWNVDEIAVCRAKMEFVINRRLPEEFIDDLFVPNLSHEEIELRTKLYCEKYPEHDYMIKCFYRDINWEKSEFTLACMSIIKTVYEMTGQFLHLSKTTFVEEDGMVKLSVCQFADVDLGMVLDRMSNLDVLSAPVMR